MTTAGARAESLPVNTMDTRLRTWGLATISLAQLMVMLDTTIVNIALPRMQHEMGISDIDRQWTVTAYTVIYGGLLLFAGRVADRIGHKRSLLIALGGFASASAMGGAAQGAAMLIGARAIQGLFAAMLTPSTMALLSLMFREPQQRAKAFGLFSAVLSAGGVVGLLTGGLLTEYLDWRWCLYVNVPIALIAIAGALFVLPATPGHRDVKLSVPAALLSCAGVASLVYGLSKASSRGWTSGSVVGFLVGALASLGLFALMQSKMTAPLLPLRVVANRNRAGAFISVALCMVGMFGNFLFMTYQFQVIMRLSPLRSGLAFLPPTIMIMITATQIAGRLLPRIGPRRLIVPGLTLAAAGLLYLTRLTPNSTYLVDVFPAQILFGLGVGCVMMPCINTAMSQTLPADLGVTSAFINTATQIGGSIGTAWLNTVAASATAAYVASSGSSGTIARPSPEATVHGYSVASAWAAGTVFAAAILAAMLIDIRPKPKAAPALRSAM